MPQGQQVLPSLVITSYIQSAAHGILCHHIPEFPDTILRRISRIEIRMGQVKAYIHHAHDHALTRESLWQVLAGIDRQGIQMGSHLIGGQAVSLTRLHTQDTGIKRQGTQLSYGYIRNTYLSYTCQHLATMFQKHLLTVITNLHESADGRGMMEEGRRKM